MSVMRYQQAWPAQARAQDEFKQLFPNYRP